MRQGIYRKLAWQGIQKNKRLYTPYMLTCIGMVMMLYIINFLADSPAVADMRGGGTFSLMMEFGGPILGVFALVFLFYTNSFLIRRRKKEFGLYNILGMGKGAIGRILVWDSLIVAVISLGCGLFLGIALSKLFELVLIRVGGGETAFLLAISSRSIWETVKWFAGIFALILINSLGQIRLSNPVGLLRSESTGEKPPKANWFLGLLGLLILGVAYYFAISIQDPVAALGWFCVAVILVIIATYLLFTAGSVTLCKFLQKNKHYYYKPNHFVSVSSMAYRMKRNGAGLASICILVTMVLVTLSSTTSLYVGKEDALNARCPEDYALELFSYEQETALDRETVSTVQKTVRQVALDMDLEIQNEKAYIVDTIPVDFNNGQMNTQPELGMRGTVLYLLELADYNSLANASETLEKGEALLYAPGFSGSTVCLDGGECWQVVKHLDEFPVDEGSDAGMSNAVYMVLPSLEMGADQSMTMLRRGWMYRMDLRGSQEDQIAFYNAAEEKLWDMQHEDPEGSAFHFFSTGKAALRDDFIATFGALFFLGGVLSIVFLLAAVLIIYYKQVSEGYEDQSRFEIMQKVGMTKGDIRRSINSQMLTVLFLPLFTAGIHLCFAFPMVQKMLLMFSLVNVKLLAVTTAVSFLAFAVVYVLVYRVTASAYYRIVSGNHAAI